MPKHISFRKWHSINIIPQISAVTVVSDDPSHSPIARLYEFVLFGFIITITIPSNKRKKTWFLTEYLGPTWNRKQKKSY